MRSNRVRQRSVNRLHRKRIGEGKKPRGQVLKPRDFLASVKTTCFVVAESSRRLRTDWRQAFTP